MDSKLAKEKLLVCDCEGTMALDGEALKKALGLESAPVIHKQLCRSQISHFENALEGDMPILTACTQEASLFREVAEEKGRDDLTFVNIRERAGWCDDQKAATPKMAALLAESVFASTPARLTTLTSNGACLVYGAGQGAFDVAMELSSRLEVTLLLTDAADIIPSEVVDVPIHRGKIVRATGGLGSFELVIDGFAGMNPSSKQGLSFEALRDGISTSCDLILDISGGTPLFASAERRDGYFHVDPNHPAGIAKALFDVSDMVGEFEKPFYVKYDADICAHGRSGKVGCSNCLDNCPVSAIAPDGDHILIDHSVCGGCGNCSTSCPTGAVSYDYPVSSDIISRCQLLVSTYLGAGGKNPVLMFHDDKHGSELISAMSRFGRGLPINVLPVSVYSPTMLGHEILASAFAVGAQQIVILMGPDRRDELAALEDQVALVNHMMGQFGFEGMSVQISDERDPDALEELLYGLEQAKSSPEPMALTVTGSKREIARTALTRLNEAATVQQSIVSLPEGSPYGRIEIASDGCTLCLSCVGACPAGALSDNPDRPEIRFTEQACVQCGICKATCPEKVISLAPQFNFTKEALSPHTLHGEDPFNCVSCGKEFGVKSTIERVAKELEGKHWMFQSGDQANVIKMCEDCRVIALAARGDNPFAGAEPPRVRTTQDYIDAEAEAAKSGRTVEDFLN